jgi:hypothetical protein
VLSLDNSGDGGNTLLTVREVYGDGHDRLSQEHLDYIRDMANRVGFTRIDDGSEPVAVIRLNISMVNPVFTVMLERDIEP